MTSKVVSPHQGIACMPQFSRRIEGVVNTWTRAHTMQYQPNHQASPPLTSTNLLTHPQTIYNLLNSYPLQNLASPRDHTLPS